MVAFNFQFEGSFVSFGVNENLTVDTKLVEKVMSLT